MFSSTCSRKRLSQTLSNVSHVFSFQIPPPQPMPNFADKSKDKPIDLQNFGLRPDLYKKNAKVRG